MPQGIPIYSALRVISASKSGSSRPAVIDTEAGYFFTKLRGAAQGVAALVAEIVVAALAEALGLWVPSRILVAISPATETAEREDEFLDLLAASHGLNLGFQYLPGASDIRPDEVEAIDANLASQVLWLDALVMNVDRTRRNPNLMRWQNQLWMIDHGAALPFQYNWSTVTEDSPRSTEYAIQHHIFWHQARHLDTWDKVLAAQLSRALLQDVVAQIPDCFLRPLLHPGASAVKVEHRRQAYAAFLWKRLKPPRPFMARWLAHQQIDDKPLHMRR